METKIRREKSPSFPESAAFHLIEMYIRDEHKYNERAHTGPKKTKTPREKCLEVWKRELEELGCYKTTNQIHQRLKGDIISIKAKIRAEENAKASNTEVESYYLDQARFKLYQHLKGNDSENCNLIESNDRYSREESVESSCSPGLNAEFECNENDMVTVEYETEYQETAEYVEEETLSQKGPEEQERRKRILEDYSDEPPNKHVRYEEPPEITAYRCEILKMELENAKIKNEILHIERESAIIRRRMDYMAAERMGAIQFSTQNENPDEHVILQ